MRILIQVEGGVVHGVSSDELLTAEVVVVDYDAEGELPENIYKVPQSEDPSDTCDAHIGFHGPIGKTDPNIVNYLNKISKS